MWWHRFQILRSSQIDDICLNYDDNYAAHDDYMLADIKHTEPVASTKPENRDLSFILNISYPNQPAWVWS